MLLSKRFTRLAALPACAALLLGNTNCNKNNNAANAPQFVTSLVVEDVNSIPTTTFAQGTTIQFALTIRNRSTSAQTLWYNTSETHNIVVLNSGTANTVWASDGCATGTGGFTSITLGAEGTSTDNQPITVQWNQKDNSGNAVAAGNYEVMGGFTVYNLTGQGSAADNGNSMATCVPTSSELFPTVYRSTLSSFTIQ